ncbi:hypothetical protein DSM104443_03711 [Usitatibacter rugosus]|uniref:Methyltransferase type 11 domain-containing protein n=1 Tax=Usitatibacter rugosus TaxID=2732067 RepID=A0A6M4GZD3_9PROT|nr:class I SAM-dependent methyltransferase [Usitatibacter rugosus]QJR12620.1 hypothetical protein DSM104443_03711 [Usitatibacter rugosus]
MTQSVLNVGGNSKQIPLPPHYEGWRHDLLDIDPRGGADVVCDARELATLPAAGYDAVWCSHNLEHYWRHDLPKVLAGFLHVLKADGFAEVRVPDMKSVFEAMLQQGLDIDDTLYVSPAGPITVNDVIYGYGKEIADSGKDFYAHKNGFTRNSLTAVLRSAGFTEVYTASKPFEVAAIAFKARPTPGQRAIFRLP